MHTVGNYRCLNQSKSLSVITTGTNQRVLSSLMAVLCFLFMSAKETSHEAQAEALK